MASVGGVVFTGRHILSGVSLSVMLATAGVHYLNSLTTGGCNMVMCNFLVFLFFFHSVVGIFIK